MDWGLVVSGIGDSLEGAITSAVVGLSVLVTAPLLIKASISVAAYALRKLQTIFGG